MEGLTIGVGSSRGYRQLAAEKSVEKTSVMSVPASRMRALRRPRSMASGNGLSRWICRWLKLMGCRGAKDLSLGGASVGDRPAPFIGRDQAPRQAAIVMKIQPASRVVPPIGVIAPSHFGAPRAIA